jgi:hypothetical protein
MRLFLPRLVLRTEAVSANTFRFIAEIALRVGPIGPRLDKLKFDAWLSHVSHSLSIGAPVAANQSVTSR